MARRSPPKESERAKFGHARSEIWERPALVAAIRREQRKLATRLRRLRAQQAMTQAEAAEKAGLHAVYVARVERGTANPTVASLVALAHAYGVSFGALFKD